MSIVCQTVVVRVLGVRSRSDNARVRVRSCFLCSCASSRALFVCFRRVVPTDREMHSAQCAQSNPDVLQPGCRQKRRPLIARCHGHGHREASTRGLGVATKVQRQLIPVWPGQANVNVRQLQRFVARNRCCCAAQAQLLYNCCGAGLSPVASVLNRLTVTEPHSASDVDVRSATCKRAAAFHSLFAQSYKCGLSRCLGEQLIT